MVVRENFTSQLEELKDKLVSIGELAQEALQKAMIALTAQNRELALTVIEEDRRINELEDAINEQALLLLAKQAPVASDLRKIIAALKISSDIERMADFAVNIAKATLRIQEPFIKPLQDLPRMADLAIGMLHDAVTAYVEEDVVLAKQLADTDDEVDALYGRISEDLLHVMTKHPNALSQITQLLLVARYLERTGDHATNIAESIFFLVKGKRYGLNE
ncbi:Phosphate transport system protein phoU-like protein [Fictibacillus macauensis ZFHKF-1]|uniref:Phosphate-specific transport system accessory protein PhoU n=1 Tax=Fictibacillus macauensis ZFHKF-1 TaxID=1196324 RepID=I8AHH9_9BACL|nr:phosphate signaling complex protein PhoU [Fictibacillus macauensis]EIT85172.1 Phosphate transport system protein phoU-like protein [Fictibacillus macauensis ZFHKF-1]